MDTYGYGAEPSEATINAWLEAEAGTSGFGDYQDMDTGDGMTEGSWLDHLQDEPEGLG